LALILSRMPWTDEDTKDVLKKVLGGLIAAAIVAIIYAILEEMPWYVAFLLGMALVILILIAIWRLGAPRRSAVDAPVSGESTRQSEHPAGGPPASTSHDAMPHPPVESGGERRLPPNGELIGGDDDKAAKKAVKAEQKRLKKEAKAREKSSKP
jgi:hypothetical protein